MARITQALVLVLSIAIAGNAQMKAASDVGIDEKLGAKVALDTVLKDEDGKDITLRQLIDKPTILLFNYFRCPGICPVLISNMVHVVNQMNLNPGKDYRLIAISFDPTDTPEKAKEKKANYLNQMRRPFSPEDWHFLTGTAENTRTVADSTGFNYHPQGDMYVHPGAIIALTPKGVISRYLYGTSFLPADVEIAIKGGCRGPGAPDRFQGTVVLLRIRPGGKGTGVQRDPLCGRRHPGYCRRVPGLCSEGENRGEKRRIWI